MNLQCNFLRLQTHPLPKTGVRFLNIISAFLIVCVIHRAQEQWSAALIQTRLNIFWWKRHKFMKASFSTWHSEHCARRFTFYTAAHHTWLTAFPRPQRRCTHLSPNSLLWSSLHKVFTPTFQTRDQSGESMQSQTPATGGEGGGRRRHELQAVKTTQIPAPTQIHRGAALTQTHRYAPFQRFHVERIRAQLGRFRMAAMLNPACDGTNSCSLTYISSYSDFDQ